MYFYSSWHYHTPNMQLDLHCWPAKYQIENCSLLPYSVLLVHTAQQPLSHSQNHILTAVLTVYRFEIHNYIRYFSTRIKQYCNMTCGLRLVLEAWSHIIFLDSVWKIIAEPLARGILLILQHGPLCNSLNPAIRVQVSVGPPFISFSLYTYVYASHMFLHLFWFLPRLYVCTYIYVCHASP